MAEFVRSAALPHLEARRSCQSTSCYRPHTHAAFSLGLIEAGTSVFAGPLSGRVRLEPGDVILIPAGQVHQCNPEDGLWRYRMVHMDQGWAESLAPDDAAARALSSGVVVLRDPAPAEACRAWTDLLFEHAPADRIEDGMRALLAALAAAAPAHTAPALDDESLRARLAPALERLREDEQPPGLDELAALVGMTRYPFIRAVKRATGLAPVAWRQNARIGRARQLLRAGAPIAETAHALGFTDQSHFHRVFRAHVAASPGAYRG